MFLIQTIQCLFWCFIKQELKIASTAQLISTNLCQRLIKLNYFLKECYLHSPNQTPKEAAYYIYIFFLLFNYSYEVGRNTYMIIRVM